MVGGISKKVNFLVSSLSRVRCMRLIGILESVSVGKFSVLLWYTK